MTGLHFVVPDQSTMLHEPAESPLHNPTPEVNRKAPLAFFFGDYLQPQGAGSTMGCYPVGEALSSVALIGPQTAQPAKALQRSPQQALGSRPVRLIGRSHKHCQQQPQRIDQDVPFNALGLFVGIEATLPGLVGGT